MEGSGLNPLDSDAETSILEGLLDKFGAAFSLEQIANAYCKAGRDANLIGAMLNELSNSTCMQPPNKLPKSEESSDVSHSDVSEESPHGVLESSKSGNNHVSGVLGKSYVSTFAKESKYFHVIELLSEKSSFNLAKDFGTNNATEELLFKMLGEGFQLDRDMIRNILGCCGYDLHKILSIFCKVSHSSSKFTLCLLFFSVIGYSYQSVEKLLDLSAVTSEKRDDFCGRSRQRSAYTSPKLESTSCAGGNLKLDLKANGSKLPRKQKGRIDIQHEVLSALFHAPGSSEEFHARTFGVNAVKKSKASGQAVVEASTNTTVESKIDKINPPNAIEEDDEGDSYVLLRKAVREYRATMKEYYKSAVDAIAKGDLSLAGRLLEEGQFYHTKAREADEESAGIIFEPRNEETEDTVTLDLHENGAKEAIRLLKCHLSSLSGIPSMKYLKVIVETNDEDTSKGSRRRLIEAEEQPEISEAYSVSAVPYFVFFKDGKTVDTLEGADPSSLANKVAKVAGPITPGEPAAPASLGMAAGPSILETVKELNKQNGSSQAEIQVPPGLTDGLKKRLQQLIDSHAVMLFIKGTPEEPKCGFSRKVVQILNEEKVKFGSFDILLDSEVREGLKKFSNWPTFPQLYCKGELLGGSDIAIAMHESGELKEVFRDHGVGIYDSNDAKLTEPNVGQGGVSESTGLSATLTARLETLVNTSPVMLFMKGKPDEPKCGFSRKVVDILKQEKVEFGTFDILTDEEVRQGLKVYSNWSSYPQLYIKGELIGGSDIVLEMQKSGELEKVLVEKGITGKETLEDRLKRLTTDSPVMLFMKGTPDAPRCGFSSKVVEALRNEGVDFGSFDILSDEEVRQGLKAFSNWPTFPQLYYKGELIGGCDIVMELRNNGELKSTLSE
ncbi:hypothetical protein RHGRI_037583 [Rhododendron griersonianum]|nr:hypothetical protein RHGRI_037583 [Rhododendron griersonianum]